MIWYDMIMIQETRVAIRECTMREHIVHAVNNDLFGPQLWKMVDDRIDIVVCIEFIWRYVESYTKDRDDSDNDNDDHVTIDVYDDVKTVLNARI